MTNSFFAIVIISSTLAGPIPQFNNNCISLIRKEVLLSRTITALSLLFTIANFFLLVYKKATSNGNLPKESFGQLPQLVAMLIVTFYYLKGISICSETLIKSLSGDVPAFRLQARTLPYFETVRVPTASQSGK